MASRSVNKVILVGNLGRDAETKFTPGGAARTVFAVATSRRWKDQASGEWKEETDWHNVVLWRSEGVANYLQKGKQVYVEGRLKTRNYEDKDGKKVYVTEVVADDVILLGGRGEGGDYGSGGGYASQGGYGGQGGYERPSGGSEQESGFSQPQRGSAPSRPRAPERREEESGPFQYGDITDDDVPF